VSRVREELEALLGTPVAEVAGPAIPVPVSRVLVGTEAVLHRVRRARAVAFLDFDQHLLAPRFVASEQALALLARAGRLVGGRDTAGAGAILVQTRLPGHEVLASAVHGDPDALARHERALRTELQLPPTTALATLQGPPAAEVVERLALETIELGDGRWLVRAADHGTLCDRLQALGPVAGLKITVDPLDV